MTITIESIYKKPNQFEQISEEELPYYRGDYLNSQYNTLRCRIDSCIEDDTYCLPKNSIWINDAIGFSFSMIKYQKYDCILEIESFAKVSLNTNHYHSIRGIWRKNVPSNYLPKYSLFREQSCIEIEKDIILISSYNNSFISNSISDGELIEIVFQNNLNIKYAQLIEP